MNMKREDGGWRIEDGGKGRRLGLGLRLRLGLGGGKTGFTLIELTISAAVASIILVASYLCLNAGVATDRKSVV